ncbi:hydroxypyruvate isomerase family protein [Pantoea sp. BAV 3049]|uniref:hydroxypyruvate isomerase family protein n=1 Tax=Pantoea sp. BAV 3049 TaxID=2654188 RepID=UPI00131C713F|nr:TIM barrel protein [Pantoea sp. BAV 3049]
MAEDGAAGGLRFCANLKWLFTELPFEQRFMAAAQAGFRAVEYALPYGWPVGFLQEKLRANGLQQILINTPVGAAHSPQRSGMACQPDSVAAFQHGMLQALEYAEALGCPYIHLQAGLQPDNVTAAAALMQFLENIHWAKELAEKQGVILLLEAINRHDIPGFFLSDYHFASDIVRQINSPSVRLMLDLYHCQVMHGDISRNIASLLPLAAHVQIADAPTRSEPGSGELNWHYVFSQLRRLGYDGWIGCEYRPLTSTAESLSWMTEKPV